MGTGIQAVAIKKRWIASWGVQADLMVIKLLKRAREGETDTWTDGAAGRLTCWLAFQQKRS